MKTLKPGDLFVVTRMLMGSRKYAAPGDLGLVISQLRQQSPAGYQAMINGRRVCIFEDELKHIPESCKTTKNVV